MMTSVTISLLLENKKCLQPSVIFQNKNRVANLFYFVPKNRNKYWRTYEFWRSSSWQIL